MDAQWYVGLFIARFLGSGIKDPIMIIIGIIIILESI